ncbi:hypothetical protein U1Q18_028462 [Sarracenia purpurea var. burkii]
MVLFNEVTDYCCWEYAEYFYCKRVPAEELGLEDKLGVEDEVADCSKPFGEDEFAYLGTYRCSKPLDEKVSVDEEVARTCKLAVD